MLPVSQPLTTPFLHMQRKTKQEKKSENYTRRHALDLMWCCKFHINVQDEGWWMVLWKMRSLSKFYPSLGISHNLLNGSRSLRLCLSVTYSLFYQVTTFFCLGLKCQSRCLGESQIYHSPPLRWHWVNHFVSVCFCFHC